jgi:hypothetical protein
MHGPAVAIDRSVSEVGRVAEKTEYLPYIAVPVVLMVLQHDRVLCRLLHLSVGRIRIMRHAD